MPGFPCLMSSATNDQRALTAAHVAIQGAGQCRWLSLLTLFGFAWLSRVAGVRHGEAHSCFTRPCLELPATCEWLRDGAACSV